MKLPMRLGTLTVMLLGCWACDRPPVRSPEELAYRSFAEAVRRGDATAAWRGLSRPTQDRMKARAKEISLASQGLIKDEPALMMFQAGVRPALTGDVKVLESDGGRAVLEVLTAGEPHHIVMVREEDQWVVELSGIF